MKKIIVGLIVLFIGSQLIVSCSSGDKVLNQFSKRKYLKKYKKENTKYKDNIDEYKYALEVDEPKNESLNYEPSIIEEVEEVDNSLVVFEKENNVMDEHSMLTVNDELLLEELNDVLLPIEVDIELEKELFEEEAVISNSNLPDDDVMFVILVVLAILISPLAVFLKEDQITNNFWINLILWLLGFGILGIGFLGLFWLAAIIHALLVVFEKV